MIGDVMGRPGRRAVKGLLPILRREFDIDLVIVNGENAANGRGITAPIVDEFLSFGIDVITSGNHIWDQKETASFIDTEIPLLRPLNYPDGVPGRGYLVVGDVLVVNLMGRVFMNDLECPFRTFDHLLESLPERPKTVFVDFHAEATSEKVAFGWYLDGRVSAVVGTHTHVPTADTRILPGGTAYVTDVGMVGPSRSVIGVEIDAVIARFLTQMPHALPVAQDGSVLFNSVLVEVDEATGKAKSIQRVDREWE